MHDDTKTSKLAATPTPVNPPRQEPCAGKEPDHTMYLYVNSTHMTSKQATPLVEKLITYPTEPSLDKCCTEQPSIQNRYDTCKDISITIAVQQPCCPPWERLPRNKPLSIFLRSERNNRSFEKDQSKKKHDRLTERAVNHTSHHPLNVGLRHTTPHDMTAAGLRREGGSGRRQESLGPPSRTLWPGG